MTDPAGRATADTLASYVGEGVADAYVSSVWAEARALVDGYAGLAAVPEVILDRAYVEAGSALYTRKDNPNGIAQFSTIDGPAPMRIARDPLAGVYPILRGYVGLGFA